LRPGEPVFRINRAVEVRRVDAGGGNLPQHCRACPPLWSLAHARRGESFCDNGFG
jgi:hypothetical protein